MIYTVLQVAGLLVWSAGCWLLAPWLGVMMLGAGMVLVGVALEWERRRNARKSV